MRRNVRCNTRVRFASDRGGAADERVRARSAAGTAFSCARACVHSPAFGEHEPANVVNVSASGVMLHAPVALPDPCGAHVQVEFLGNVSRGVVRHVSGAPYGRFVGIEFDSEPK